MRAIASHSILSPSTPQHQPSHPHTSLSYLTNLSVPYVMVMLLSILFLCFSPPFCLSPSFFFFLIPTEWNPLRRGGGCNRLTICYYSTCSSPLPCILFPNAIVYSVSLFPFRIVAGLGCSFQPLASSPAAFLVSLVTPRSNKLFAFVHLALLVFVDPLVKES